MKNEAKATFAANEDTSVKTVADSISGLEHRTITGEGGVTTDKIQLGTFGTRRFAIKTNHLAGILMALDEREGIDSGRNTGVGVLEGVADLDAVYEEAAFSPRVFGKRAFEMDNHKYKSFGLTVNTSTTLSAGIVI